jgi:hypothetical protein
MCCGDDAVDENNLVLCFALCCVNLSLYPTCDCIGCSGKVSRLAKVSLVKQTVSHISCRPVSAA